jgi:glycosyltransferase involved in cell wall biosynthesis
LVDDIVDGAGRTAQTSSHSRVILIAPSTHPRGITMHCLYLAQALQRLGTAVHLLAPGDPDRGLPFAMPVPNTIVPVARAYSLEARIEAGAAALVRGLEELAVTRSDIVHIQSVVGFGALAWRAAGVAIARTVHHIGHATTVRLAQWQRQSITEPDLLLAVSEECAGQLRDAYQISADVVPNGVDSLRFRRPQSRRGRRPGTPFTFLYVAAIDPGKGTLILVDAFAQVSRRVGPDRVRLVLVGGVRRGGDGYGDAVRAACDSLRREFGVHVILTGVVDDARLRQWYWDSDAYVLASRREGWALTVLEAMAAGLPVVATSLPVLREYVGDDEALLVPVGDSGYLADAMASLVRDDRLWARLAAAGPPVANRYSWERCAARHRWHYESLGMRGRPGQPPRGNPT